MFACSERSGDLILDQEWSPFFGAIEIVNAKFRVTIMVWMDGWVWMDGGGHGLADCRFY